MGLVERVFNGGAARFGRLSPEAVRQDLHRHEALETLAAEQIPSPGPLPSC